MQRLHAHASFGGRQEVWRHMSTSTGTPMQLGLYLPPAALAGDACPVLYWLSGLTCSEQNFITKAGAQQFAAAHGLVLVAPDTSPRGGEVADDLGQGASFYVNATRAPWARHYRMHDYIVDELPALIEAHFPVTERRAISGHSMGGHGALVAALRRPGRYRSVSAFSPIVAPSRSPWGEKAFTAYLGPERAAWADYDATALIGRAAGTPPILIDQGEADEFLQSQLRIELFRAAAEAAARPVDVRMRPGYDHSYYFVASFIGEHIAWHADALRA